MAYLTTQILREEGGWYFTNWQPVLDSSGFTTFLDRIVARAANHVAWRVGAADYATTDTVEQGILQEMELALGMYYLCVACATIANSSEDPQQNPVAGAGQGLRDSGEAYKGRLEELLGWWGAASHATYSQPAADASTPEGELVPNFTQSIDWAQQGS